jgi:hypothetical protein
LAGSSSGAAGRRRARADTVGAVVVAEQRLDQRPGQGEGSALPLGVGVVHLSRLAVVPNDAGPGVVEGDAGVVEGEVVDTAVTGRGGHESPLRGCTASPIG